MRVLIKNDSDPVKMTTIDPNNKPWDQPLKRVGRPKIKWLITEINNLWKLIQGAEHKLTDLDIEVNTKKSTQIQTK